MTNVEKGSTHLVNQTRETAEEKQAMADFGSSDSGASLGDILGAALLSATATTTGKTVPQMLFSDGYQRHISYNIIVADVFCAKNLQVAAIRYP